MKLRVVSLMNRYVPYFFQLRSQHFNLFTSNHAPQVWWNIILTYSPKTVKEKHLQKCQRHLKMLVFRSAFPRTRSKVSSQIIGFPRLVPISYEASFEVIATASSSISRCLDKAKQKSISCLLRSETKSRKLDFIASSFKTMTSNQPFGPIFSRIEGKIVMREGN